MSGDDFISPLGEVSVGSGHLLSSRRRESRISLWGAVQDFIDALKTTPFDGCSTNGVGPSETQAKWSPNTWIRR